MIIQALPRSKQTTKDNQYISLSKSRFVSILVLLMFISVVVFLIRWQIIDNPRFEAMAAARYERTEVKALRGDVLASDGSVLAFSEPVFDIFVYLDEEQGLIAAEDAGRQTRAEFIKKVSRVLEISEEELQDTIDNSPNKWLQIANDVSIETRDLIMTLPTDKDPDIFIDGLNYEQTSKRIYPEGQLASHVLGFVGSDEFGNIRGGSGLELYFDGVLKPQSGISAQEIDSNENIIALSAQEIRNSRRGATIKTTIDKNIQGKTEELLEKYVQQFEAQSGTVIIMDPQTGGIISLANYPDFEPQSFYEVGDNNVLGNIAITNPYEIGSVGKVYTMAAAVDQGKVEPNTIIIDGHEGCQEIIDQKIICTYDKKPQGPLTSTEALIKSDNLALFATANLVGQEKLANYLEDFGMGKKTGVQLSGEDIGYIKDGKSWNEADLAAYSYGHSYFQTTVQAVTGLGALANDGMRMEPMIVSELIEADGSRRVYEPREVKQVITPESSTTMGEMMYQVYLNNLYEDKYGHLEKYYIGMKSGTALIPYTSLANPQQIPGYSNEVNSTYVGYDASDKHSFIMLVNISEPQTNPKLSYNNARILWLELFDEIKNELGVPKVYP